ILLVAGWNCASNGGFDRECRIERRSSDITFPFPGSPRPAGFNARCPSRPMLSQP
ncbi:hypothetical protein LTSEJOH_2614, partial [Salmonella enterica subsp. enterica serovar Johannesburg str. S5-703]